MAKVRVFARAKAKAGKEMEVREILLGLVKASRAEDGVVFYELFEYADAEGFEAHKSSDHFKQAGGAVQPLLDGELSIWVVDPVEPVL
jgi:quinol monooxygenase YgiN